MTPLLCDSHCHLDWFDSPEDVVKRAEDAGVEVILSNATSLASLEKNIALSKKSRSVRCALGIHPVDLLSMDNAGIEGAFRVVEENISSASAVGEVGMDFKLSLIHI